MYHRSRRPDSAAPARGRGEFVMPEAGFFAQKRNSPTSLGLVILLHAALIARRDPDQEPRLPAIASSADPGHPDPDRDGSAARSARRPRPSSAQTAAAERIDQATAARPDTAHRPGGRYAPRSDAIAGRPPVTARRHSAAAARPAARPGAPRAPRSTRASSQLQPPYPAAEQRAQRDGRVQVRVTIAPERPGQRRRPADRRPATPSGW